MRSAHGVSRGSVVVCVDHVEFGLTELKVASVIRLDKVCTVLKDLIAGEVGFVGDTLRREVNEAILEIYSF